MLKLNLIRQIGNGSYLDCFDEIETTLTKNKVDEINVILSKNTRLKNVILQLLLKVKNVTKYFVRRNGLISFSPQLGSSFGSLIPHIFRLNHNFIYMYDAWPSFHGMIARTAELLNIRVIFFSSSRVTTLFNKLNSGVKAIWIPEGINLNDYYFEPYASKTIDVLEFGRKYDQYHDKIVSALLQNNHVHLFEKKKGQLVFGNRSEFLCGLAKSRISICVPSNITHPDRSEGISSMTLRYLQSMASKCLIVGVIPEEMKLLFDYTPIVEIDFDDPEAQILNLLADYESYIPLIEKNYLELQQSHTWEVRFEKMLQIIQDEAGLKNIINY